jgi:hypothetical protein
MNVGRLDRPATAKLMGWTEKQISKAYNNWIQIFRYSDSTLTLEQYLAKLKESGISPDDVGINNEQYQLARYNDEGPYTKESCRFILKIENLNEQIRQPIYFMTLKKYGKEKTRQIMQNNASRLNRKVDH